MSITFENVSHVYGVDTPFEFHALKNVQLNIKNHSFTAIIGQTGSGKSTLIQHINALLLPTQGSIKIDDYLISVTNKPEKLKQLRQKAGLVFQFPEYQLFEETIEKDIMFGPLNFGKTEQEAKEIARSMIKIVGLDESYLDKSPFDLSGGQKRRVAIAGILAMNPDILILDEPTAGLDPQGTKDMMNLFKSIHESGKTIIIVTHDMNHVLEYCDDVIVMNHGEVERHDTVTQIFQDSEYLNQLGIDLPMMTRFILDLNEQGYHIDPSINCIEDLIEAIGGEING
ncbi:MULTISPECIES: energy-coupling factor transporter ATPase [Coprobacillaceae]|uniref:energy-coupling factor transporter ATPase n=1 Tax=Coprobacillaceae TaxID=2810280 RepID=UPI000E5492D8|nr:MULTISPECIES: energy-coupling factor transporter ATPase [Coprobacillaceae]RHM61133.1 energy-coupling factor transporter ATPase [Coprobacillus sp. AF33-1AC]RHS92953.1 energy-coupling factor transporter ATPase [Erysipelatoclostridium sp. AM42-17]